MKTTAHTNWKQEADARIEKVRKGDFELHATDPDGNPVSGAELKISQTQSAFQFGTAISDLIKPGAPDWENYEQFILEHFNTLVCENAMKWYATEKEPGVLSYEDADRLTDFAESHGLAMRGHCLFWSKTKFVQSWVQALAPADLQKAINARIEEIVSRYKGRLSAWDGINEMLDGAFFHDRLGPDANADIFRRAHAIDPATPLFVNEYSILDNDPKLSQFKALIESLENQGASIGGIGIQEHAAERFVDAQTGEIPDRVNPERASELSLVPGEIWRRLDDLGQYGLPIHLTEISVKTPDQERRADALEALLRVGFAHKSVENIMLWGFWEKLHWLRADASLVDANWNVLPAGQRLRKLLLEEWRTHTKCSTDADGVARFRGFYGKYTVTCTLASGVVRVGSVNLPAGVSRATVQL